MNRSTRGATDAVMFVGTPMSKGWGLTLLGGGHWQERTDVNDDAWADLPGYTRGVFRPRVFWDGGNGRTFFATTGVTVEDRNGGTCRARSCRRPARPTSKRSTRDESMAVRSGRRCSRR